MDTVIEELSKDDDLTSREVTQNFDITSEFSFIGARSNIRPVNFRLLKKNQIIGSMESSLADETLESQIDAVDVPRFATSAHSSYYPLNIQNLQPLKYYGS